MNVSQAMKHLTMEKLVAISMNVYKITAVVRSNVQTPMVALNVHALKDSKQMEKLATVLIEMNAMLTMETAIMNVQTLKVLTCARVVLVTASPRINIIASIQVVIFNQFSIEFFFILNSF